MLDNLLFPNLKHLRMHIPATWRADALEVCSRISGLFSEPFSQKMSGSDKQPTETTLQIIGSYWDENAIESLMRQYPYLLHNVHELQLEAFEMSAHVLSLLAPLELTIAQYRYW
jgi:hypothetical protein